MQVVYVISRQRALRGAVADRRDAVPAEGIVFALCDGARTLISQDEDFLEAITSGECRVLKTLTSVAAQRENDLKA